MTCGLHEACKKPLTLPGGVVQSEQEAVKLTQSIKDELRKLLEICSSEPGPHQIERL